MGAKAPQIVDDLRQQLDQLEHDRAREIEAVEARYGHASASVREAIDALSTTNGNAPLGYMDRRPPVSLSISQEKLEKIRKWIDKHPRCRQTEIVKGTKLNSGTVSVGLRVLAQEEQPPYIQPGPKDNGSQIWEKVSARVPAAA